jgi:hypothetical protein
MSKELDEQCARALGWRKHDVREAKARRAVAGGYELHPDVYLLTEFFWYATVDGKQRRMGAASWSPSTDLVAARILEDEIERRGLQERYMRALIRSVLGEAFMTRMDIGRALDEKDLFLLLRATPEQRARAFLEGMKA